MDISLSLTNWGITLDSEWLLLDINWALLLIVGVSVVAYRIIKTNKKGKK